MVIWAPNHWRTPVYLFALWKLGAVVVPFDREMNPEGAARIVDAVEPRCILVGYDERPAWSERPNVVEWWEPRYEASAAASTTPWRQPSEELAAICSSELAEWLVISENTVKYHLRNILDKLHVQNRAQVVAYAVRHAMITGS